jgi:ketoreductase RED2
MRLKSDDVCDISNADFSHILNTNVVGTWCITREAIPHLKKSGDGNIINITSCTGIDPAGGSRALLTLYQKRQSINSPNT